MLSEQLNHSLILSRIVFIRYLCTHRPDNTLNLLGEDSIVLSKLVHALGVFLECAGTSVNPSALLRMVRAKKKRIIANNDNTTHIHRCVHCWTSCGLFGTTKRPTCAELFSMPHHAPLSCFPLVRVFFLSCQYVLDLVLSL